MAQSNELAGPKVPLEEDMALFNAISRGQYLTGRLPEDEEFPFPTFRGQLYSIIKHRELLDISVGNVLDAHILFNAGTDEVWNDPFAYKVSLRNNKTEDFSKADPSQTEEVALLLQVLNAHWIREIASNPSIQTESEPSSRLARGLARLRKFV